tara:strand:- start:47 stop:253 length:207 start_codon:yes stop_codon:yes gene_type:complete
VLGIEDFKSISARQSTQAFGESEHNHKNKLYANYKAINKSERFSHKDIARPEAFIRGFGLLVDIRLVV